MSEKDIEETNRVATASVAAPAPVAAGAAPCRRDLDDERYLAFLEERRREISERIAEACRRAGRDEAEVARLAVSKTVGPAEVLAAIRAGWRLFGENRPQELVRKLEALAQVPGVPPVRFDMIGNLQTNKINAVLGRAELIHSVSSLHLARSVSERALRRMEAGALAAPADVLIEVNVSGEASKSGFSPKELVCGLDELSGLRGIRVRGLMTMAPRGERDVARRTFAGLRELRDELRRRVPEMDLGELSCGMSEDFEVAVEEGSTLVRLGRVVFDPAFGIK